MLGILSTLLPILSPIINKLIPGKASKVKAALEVQLLQHQGTIISALAKSDMAQVAINNMDSQSKDRFRSWWRPALGWVCVSAFCWLTVLQPVIVLVVTLYTGSPPSLPTFDSSILNTVLFGMLGLSATRSFDKLKGLLRK